MLEINETPRQGPYETERKQILNEIGDLESIRQTLGLSRRKICKLLLVDPSSWTRWTKPDGNPPAYIYRSLQWCLAIMEKYPESHPLVRSLSYEKENKVDLLHKKIEERLGLHRSIAFDVQSEVTQIKLLNKEILESNARLKKITYILIGLSLVLFFGFIFKVF